MSLCGFCTCSLGSFIIVDIVVHFFLFHSFYAPCDTSYILVYIILDERQLYKAFEGDKRGEIKVNIQSWYNELQGCGDDVCHFRIFFKELGEKVRLFYL